MRNLKSRKILATLVILLLLLSAYLVFFGDTQVQPKPIQRGDAFSFTVNSFKCGIEKAGSDVPYTLQAVAQGQFCIVDVTVRNRLNEVYSFSSRGQYLIGINENKSVMYAPDLLATELINVAWKEIEPGDVHRAKIAFDIPKTAKITSIELRETPEAGGISVSVPKSQAL